MKANQSIEPDDQLSVQAQSLHMLCALATGEPLHPSSITVPIRGAFKEIFLEQLSWHQLAPLIDQSNELVGGCLPGETGEQISRLKMEVAANALKHLQETLALTDQLTSIGIRVICLKGPVLSQQLYGTPVKRHSRDIDLLVAINDVPEVTRQLMGRGYDCELSEFLEPGFHRQYTFLSKDVSFYHPVKNIIIELHWRLMSNPELMPIGFEDAWRARENLTLNNSSVAVLGPDENALYLACHGSIAHWARLKWVSDWHQLMKNDAVDWEKVLTKARMMDKEIYLKNACDNASYWFGEQAIEAPAELTGRVSNYLLRTNRSSQLRHEYPSVIKGAFNRLLMAGSASAIWQEYLRSLGTSVADIKAVRLPVPLFPLYYLFRPFIYLARKLGIPERP